MTPRPSDPSHWPQACQCPHCRQDLHVAISMMDQVTCPNCGSDFTYQPETGAIPLITEQPPDTQPADDASLDAMRIRRLTIARQATIRARSYCAITAIACAVIAIQLALNAMHPGLESFEIIESISRVIAVVLALTATLYFARRTHQLSQELRHFDGVQ